MDGWRKLGEGAVVVAQLAFFAGCFTLVAIALSSCAMTGYGVGETVEQVERKHGIPDMARNGRLYWCDYERGVGAQLFSVKVNNGVVVEAMRFMYAGSGDCLELLTQWAKRLEYAEIIGLVERIP